MTQNLKQVVAHKLEREWSTFDDLDWEEELTFETASDERTMESLLGRIALFHRGPIGRCRTCGARVFLPCLACECRSTEAKQGRPDNANAMSAGSASLAFELKPRHRERYEAIRGARESGLKRLQ